MMPLISSQVSSSEGTWWLLDSGAATSVLSQIVARLRRIRQKHWKPTMQRMGLLFTWGPSLAFQVVTGASGKKKTQSFKKACCIGDVSHNIISTTQLVKKGWSVIQSPGETYLYHEDSGTLIKCCCGEGLRGYEHAGQHNRAWRMAVSRWSWLSHQWSSQRVWKLAWLELLSCQVRRSCVNMFFEAITRLIHTVWNANRDEEFLEHQGEVCVRESLKFRWISSFWVWLRASSRWFCCVRCFQVCLVSLRWARMFRWQASICVKFWLSLVCLRLWKDRQLISGQMLRTKSGLFCGDLVCQGSTLWTKLDLRTMIRLDQSTVVWEKSRKLLLFCAWNWPRPDWIWSTAWLPGRPLPGMWLLCITSMARSRTQERLERNCSGTHLKELEFPPCFALGFLQRPQKVLTVLDGLSLLRICILSGTRLLILCENCWWTEVFPSQEFETCFSDWVSTRSHWTFCLSLRFRWSSIACWSGTHWDFARGVCTTSRSGAASTTLGWCSWTNWRMQFMCHSARSTFQEVLWALLELDP